MLNDKTEVLRGNAAAKIADIKAGERIVVKYVTSRDKAGKETHEAKPVRLP